MQLQFYDVTINASLFALFVNVPQK